MRTTEQIREDYIQEQILKKGEILEGNLEIIDRRSNYVVVVDKNGNDYKMFLDEAYERSTNKTINEEARTPKSKKTISEIISGGEKEISYKGYRTRNFRYFDELRESISQELSDSHDAFATLHYIKAVDEMAFLKKKEIEESLTEEDNRHLNRLIDRAKKYGHSKDSYKKVPYHDKDIRTTNVIPVKESDSIEKFLKSEKLKETQSKINVRDFLSEELKETDIEHSLNKLENDKDKVEKLADKVDDFEDIAHLYDSDDIHLYEELTESISREERIRRKIAFAKTKAKRERSKEIALKRLSNKAKLVKKARKAAVELIKIHISKKPLEKLTISEKERLENMISKRKDLINRLAMKLAPKIAQIERNRIYGQHNEETETPNYVEDDFVDVADEDEKEGNDVSSEQKDKAHDKHMNRKFVTEEDKCCDDMHESLLEELIIEDSEYQGKKVKLNKPFRISGGPKKFAVYTKNDKGNVVRVTFGSSAMEIKRDDPERRASYRARHNCADPGPKWKANYWSCRFWSNKSVTDILAEDLNDFPDSVTHGSFYHGGADVDKLHPLSFFSPNKENADSYARVYGEGAKIHEIQIQNLNKPARDRDVINAAKELGHYEDEYTPANHYLSNSTVEDDVVREMISHLKSKGFDHARLHDNDYNSNEFTSVLPFHPETQIIK